VLVRETLWVRERRLQEHWEYDLAEGYIQPKIFEPTNFLGEEEQVPVWEQLWVTERQVREYWEYRERDLAEYP